tara:strand:- start:52 stop:264 length:213 start_codon:yes stop_codon:yes gene_type:complete
MASVKASAYVPPFEEHEFIESLEQIIEFPKINIHVIIYILIGITLLLFVKKLIATVCRRLRGQKSGAKLE